MYGGMPSRRWCREVLAVRRSVQRLLSTGVPLSDPQLARLSRRLERLLLTQAFPVTRQPSHTGVEAPALPARS